MPLSQTQHHYSAFHKSAVAVVAAAVAEVARFAPHRHFDESVPVLLKHTNMLPHQVRSLGSLSILNW